jgi:hypothetical protein
LDTHGLAYEIGSEFGEPLVQFSGSVQRSSLNKFHVCAQTFLFEILEPPDQNIQHMPSWRWAILGGAMGGGRGAAIGAIVGGGAAIAAQAAASDLCQQL